MRTLQSLILYQSLFLPHDCVCSTRPDLVAGLSCPEAVGLGIIFTANRLFWWESYQIFHICETTQKWSFWSGYEHVKWRRCCYVTPTKCRTTEKLRRCSQKKPEVRNTGQNVNGTERIWRQKEAESQLHHSVHLPRSEELEERTKFRGVCTVAVYAESVFS